MTDISARFNLAYPGFALHVDLQLPTRGVTALFGPSGSGKTTLLRCIAGLERAEGGFLRVHGEIWQDSATFMPTHLRSLGYVFQEPSLFPHLSVQRNMEYGLRRIHLLERKVQLDRVVELLGLRRLIKRNNPSSLSGGERQRIAIGRALLTSPRLLLMDEPLSALDTASKQEILPYLERLHRELEIPVIYVSHALNEVARLADHVVLLEHGRVIASGLVSETLPSLDAPAIRLDDAGVDIEASVSVHDEAYHLTRLDFSGGYLWAGYVERSVGSVVRVRVLARDVSVATAAPQGTSITNIFTARINEIQDEGRDCVNLRLAVCGETALLSRVTRQSRDQLGLVAGRKIFAQVHHVTLIA